MAKKTGRPAKAAQHRKSELMQIRLGESEKCAFQEAADLAGIGVSTWVRERLRQVAARELQAASRPVAFLGRRTGA